MLKTSFANIELDTCIYNASGPRCTTLNELLDLENSDSAAVLTKSCTMLPRDGNVGKRYAENEIMSINSTGLANMGYKFYADLVNKWWDKPYIISVAGLTFEDNEKILMELGTNPPDAIELNLSCPNIAGKSQVSYDYDTMETYLRKIYDITLDTPLNIGIKLSPYFDKNQFVECAELIAEYPVKFVTCINSLGYGLIVDIETEKPAIEPNDGYGGIGGKSILPTALSNVRQFRHFLPDRIDVIGCGGVETGADVFRHLLVGAKAVQVGTQLMKEGPEVFTRLKKELKTIMERKGYRSIEEFYNKC